MELLSKEWPLLPPRFTSNVNAIMRMVREHDWDWLHVVYGGERTGKTALSVLMLLTAEQRLHDAILSADYDETLERFSWDFDAMLETVRVLPRGSAICYQEASMLGRESMRKWNIRMVRVMTTIGARNILYVLTFPRFTMLDPYLRYRARSMSHVRTRHGLRGYARCYYRGTVESHDDDGMRYAFDTMFRDTARIPELVEFWAKLMEKETTVKDGILARHGARENPD